MKKSYVKEIKDKVTSIKIPLKLYKSLKKLNLNVNQICNDALVKAVKDEGSRAK